MALDISGQHTDLDKSILDALGEPLMHLVRNAVDHGNRARWTNGLPRESQRGTGLSQRAIIKADSGCHQKCGMTAEALILPTFENKPSSRGLSKAEEAARTTAIRKPSI